LGSRNLCINFPLKFVIIAIPAWSTLVMNLKSVFWYCGDCPGCCVCGCGCRGCCVCGCALTGFTRGALTGLTLTGFTDGDFCVGFEAFWAGLTGFVSVLDFFFLIISSVIFYHLIISFLYFSFLLKSCFRYSFLLVESCFRYSVWFLKS